MRIRTRVGAGGSSLPIPRTGFLLLLLAVGIVVYSRTPASLPVLPTTDEVEVTADTGSPEPDAFVAVANSETQDESNSEKQDDKGDSPGNLAGIVVEESESASEKSELTQEMRELLSLVSDNTFEIMKLEMPAYWGLLKVASDAGLPALESAVKRDITFNELYRRPSQHRGKLCKLEFVARKVIRHPSKEGNAAGFNDVYEIWGNTDQSKAWLYVFVTDSLPEGFDEKSLLYKRVKFAGYFFKVLAYHPGSPTASSKPLAAPMLIGKVQAGSKLPVRPSNNNTAWTVAFGAIVAVSIVGSIWAFGRRKTRKPQSNPTEWNWLDQQ